MLIFFHRWWERSDGWISLHNRFGCNDTSGLGVDDCRDFLRAVYGPPLFYLGAAAMELLLSFRLAFFGDLFAPSPSFDLFPVLVRVDLATIENVAAVDVLIHTSSRDYAELGSHYRLLEWHQLCWILGLSQPQWQYRQNKTVKRAFWNWRPLEWSFPLPRFFCPCLSLQLRLNESHWNPVKGLTPDNWRGEVFGCDLRRIRPTLGLTQYSSALETPVCCQSCHAFVVCHAKKLAYIKYIISVTAVGRNCCYV